MPVVEVKPFTKKDKNGNAYSYDRKLCRCTKSEVPEKNKNAKSVKFNSRYVLPKCMPAGDIRTYKEMGIGDYEIGREECAAAKNAKAAAKKAKTTAKGKRRFMDVGESIRPDYRNHYCHSLIPD